MGPHGYLQDRQRAVLACNRPCQVGLPVTVAELALYVSLRSVISEKACHGQASATSRAMASLNLIVMDPVIDLFTHTFISRSL
jgi:hypothetical protein